MRPDRWARIEQLLQVALEKLLDDAYVAPTTFATLHAALGSKEQAFSWLARAREQRDFLLVLAAVEPIFDALRDDARFTALLASMKFPGSPPNLAR